MIDGTLFAILGALVLAAIGRAIYERGWHAGRAALLREQAVRRRQQLAEADR